MSGPLGFGDRIAARPRVATWMQRLFARHGYQTGVQQWFNPGYLELFERERPAARERIARITAV